MKERKLAGLPVLLILLLGILAAVWSARVAAHFRGLRLELGRVKLSRLDEETRRRLETLKDDVFITYYVSERSRMPSNMRRVERGATDLLEALRGASRGRLGYQIVDPGTDADLVRFASHRGVAPFRGTPTASARSGRRWGSPTARAQSRPSTGSAPSTSRGCRRC